MYIHHQHSIIPLSLDWQLIVDTGDTWGDDQLDMRKKGGEKKGKKNGRWEGGSNGGRWEGDKENKKIEK